MQKIFKSEKEAKVQSMIFDNINEQFQDQNDDDKTQKFALDHRVIRLDYIEEHFKIARNYLGEKFDEDDYP